MIDGRILDRKQLQNKIEELENICALDRKTLRMCKYDQQAELLEESIAKMEDYIDDLREELNILQND